jgi:hypothetical protein
MMDNTPQQTDHMIDNTPQQPLTDVWQRGDI